MKKKTIIAIVVVLLALALIVGGIMAYFTSTDQATNTFTIGNVKIDLLEPAWTGAIATGEAQPASAQNMVPGGSVAKDPKIKNIGTNDANVFLKVDIPCYTVGASTVDLFNLYYGGAAGVNTTDWKLVGQSTSGNTHTYVYAYASDNTKAGLKELASDATTNPLFDHAQLTTNTTVVEAAAATSVTDAGRSIEINAYGIQTTEVTQDSQLNIFKLFEPTFTPQA